MPWPGHPVLNISEFILYTLRQETSVLEYLNTLISSPGCNDLICYLEMFHTLSLDIFFF